MPWRLSVYSTMEGAPWGGSEYLWAGAVERMARAGWHVEVSAKSWPSQPPLDRLAAAGCRVSRRRAPSLASRAIRRIVDGPSDLARWLRAGAPDLLVVSMAGYMDGARLAADLTTAAPHFALVVQSVCEHEWPDDGQLAAMRTLYGAARAVYFVAERNRAFVERLLGRALPRTIVLRNPLNVSRDAGPAWPAGGLRLACVARLEPAAKGQDLAIRALAGERWRSRDWTLTFFGDGAHGDAVRSLGARLLGERAVFAGQVANVEEIWRDHHALVLPSRFEGTPLSLLEAATCARPAVVTDVGGNAEIVAHGLSGFVAPAATVEAVDAALDALWSARERLPEMELEARRRALALQPADPVGVLVAELERLVEAGAAGAAS